MPVFSEEMPGYLILTTGRVDVTRYAGFHSSELHPVDRRCKRQIPNQRKAQQLDIPKSISLDPDLSRHRRAGGCPPVSTTCSKSYFRKQT